MFAVAKGVAIAASIASSVTTNAKTVSYALPAIHQASSDSSGLASDTLQLIEKVLTPVAGAIPFAATAVLVLKTLQATLEHIDAWTNRDDWINAYRAAIDKITRFMCGAKDHFTKDNPDIKALEVAAGKTEEVIKKQDERGQAMRFLAASYDKQKLANCLEDLRQLMLNCVPDMTLELKKDLIDLGKDVNELANKVNQIHNRLGRVENVVKFADPNEIIETSGPQTAQDATRSRRCRGKTFSLCTSGVLALCPI